MRPRPFRFSPPEVPLSAELRWVLAHCFSLRGLEPTPNDGPRALELAQRLGLLPRLAARLDPVVAESAVGVDAARRLRDVRSVAIARELWFEETERALAAVAAGSGLEPALLKGRALTRAGDAAPGARPASDIDLLVPGEALSDLKSELLRAGFEEVRDASYEHHDRPLRFPGGAPVELHRHLPGVRLDGHRSASWVDLDRAGLLDRRPARDLHPSLRIPARELLTAHALVHALAQHGLATGYPGWLLIGDLLDLGAAGTGPAEAPLAPGWNDWIAGALSRDEIAAAVTLAERLATSRTALDGAPDEPALLLARHFTACALDADYGRALKSRWLDEPLSDRPPLLARLRLIVGALTPPIDDSPAGRDRGRVARALGWIARPFQLAARSLRSLAARLRISRRPPRR